MVTEKIFETALGIKQPLVHRRDELRAHPEEAKYPCRFRGWQPLCRAGAGRNGPDPPMQRSAYAGQLDLLKLSSVWCIPRHLEQFRHAHFTCSEIYGSRYSDATPLKFSTHTLPADHTSHQILSVPPQRTPRFYSLLTHRQKLPLLYLRLPRSSTLTYSRRMRCKSPRRHKMCSELSHDGHL